MLLTCMALYGMLSPRFGVTKKQSDLFHFIVLSRLAFIMTMTDSEDMGFDEGMRPTQTPRKVVPFTDSRWRSFRIRSFPHSSFHSFLG